MMMSQDAAVAHPIVGACTSASAAVRSVQDAAFFGLNDSDLEFALAECEQLRALEFDLMLRLVAEADGRDLGRQLGASSTMAWLRDRLRLRPGEAKRRVDLANRVRVDDGPIDYSANVGSPVSGREMPATGAALAEGAISPEHVAAVAQVMRNLPDDIGVDKARAVEADMAGFCREHDPATVAKLGKYLLGLLEADSLDDDNDKRWRRRDLRCDEESGRISGRLDAEGMAVLRSALAPLAAPKPAEDGSMDTRTAGQRLADALVELARRAIASGELPTNHGLTHRVMVHIGLDTLHGEHTSADDAEDNVPDEADADRSGAEHGDSDAGGADHASAATGEAERGGPEAEHAGAASGCGHAAGSGAPGELLWGGPITTEAVRRIACHAGVQRVILDPAGAVLDVGREYRTVTSAQFAALIARDGGCAFPGCTRIAAWCEAHHIRHWADGGPTDLDNLVLLCGYHHRTVHHRGWDITVGPDRLPGFRPPPWIDPDRAVRRNNRPRYERYAAHPPDG